MKLIIGIVGENGAGKTSVLKYLKQKLGETTCQTLRFSDVLSETLALWDIPQTRANLQLLPQLMDSGYGPGSLSRAVAKRIEESSSDILLIDGVRWDSDEKLIRSFKNSLLVYVTAPPRLRFQRLKARREKAGEDVLTWEQFLVEDSAPNEVQIPHIGKRANFVITNTSSEEILNNYVLKLMEMIKTALR